MTPSTPAKSSTDAVRAGRAEIGSANAPWYGLCLVFVRTALGIPALYPSAIAAWNGATKRHTGNGTPPAGAPVFWSSRTFGHIALSVGGGRILSSDILRRGHVDEVPIGTIAARWGLTYLGWTEDLNGWPVDVAGRTPTPPPPVAPPKPATPPKEDDMWTPDQADTIEKRYVLAHQRWLAETGAERSLSDAIAAKMLADGKPYAEILAELDTAIWTPVARVQADALAKLAP